MEILEANKVIIAFKNSESGTTSPNVTLALGRLRQEDEGFEAIMDFIVRSCLKTPSHFMCVYYHIRYRRR
jgi:hypothetical protein